MPINDKTKKQYVQNKGVAMSLEKDNYQYIHVFPSSNGYHKILGHSALIYYYRICPRLKLKPNLLEDTDFEYKSYQGVIAIKSLETLTTNLKKLKLKPVNVSNVFSCSFQLAEPLTEDQFKELEKLEDAKREELHKITRPNHMNPDFLVESINVVRIFKDKIHAFDAPTREFLSRGVVDHILRMPYYYTRLTHGLLSPETFKKIIEEDIVACFGWLNIVDELGCMNINACAEMARSLQKMKDALPEIVKCNAVIKQTDAAAVQKRQDLTTARKQMQ